MEAISKLDCSSEFKLSNFRSLSREYRGQDFRYFAMTKDGFTFLAMGFTGSRAAAFKEKYITAFNQMAKKLSAPAIAPPAELTITQLFEMLGKRIAVIEENLLHPMITVEATPVQLTLVEAPTSRDTVRNFALALGLELSAGQSRASQN